MKRIKRAICALFGHKPSNSWTTQYSLGGYLFWQCPRCGENVAKVKK